MAHADTISDKDRSLNRFFSTLFGTLFNIKRVSLEDLFKGVFAAKKVPEEFLQLSAGGINCRMDMFIEYCSEIFKVPSASSLFINQVASQVAPSRALP